MALKPLVITFVFAFLIFGAFSRPILGVLGYIAIYSCWMPQSWWGDIVGHYYFFRPSFIASFILLLAMIFHRKKIHWQIKRREWELYLFLVVLWISSVLGQGMNPDAWFLLTKMTKVFIFLFMLHRIVNKLKDYRLLVWSLILSGVFLGYEGYIAPTGAFYGNRLNMIGGADFSQSNELAIYLLSTLLFAGIEFVRISSWHIRLLSIPGMLLILNTIILTRTRAIFLALLGIVPLYLFWAPNKSRRFLYFLGILGGLSLFLLSDPGFFLRMGTIHERVIGDLSKSEGSRMDMWKASVPLFLDYPLGVGIGNFPKVIGRYDKSLSGIDAHNTFVLCYSELGIQGLLLLLIILVRTILQLRHINSLARGTVLEKELGLHVFALFLVISAHFIGYITHSGLYMESTWWLLAMPICLESVAKNELENSEKPNNCIE